MLRLPQRAGPCQCLTRDHVCPREIWKCDCWVGLHRSWVHERRSVSCYRRGRHEVRCSNRQILRGCPVILPQVSQKERCNPNKTTSTNAWPLGATWTMTPRSIRLCRRAPDGGVGEAVTLRCGWNPRDEPTSFLGAEPTLAIATSGSRLRSPRWPRRRPRKLSLE
jgi:hypothetical protein